MPLSSAADIGEPTIVPCRKKASRRDKEVDEWLFRPMANLGPARPVRIEEARRVDVADPVVRSVLFGQRAH
jgi:hypothetical protein